MLLLHMFHPGSNTYVQIYQEKQKRSSIYFLFFFKKSKYLHRMTTFYSIATSKCRLKVMSKKSVNICSLTGLKAIPGDVSPLTANVT